MKPDESKIRKDNFCSQATSDEICNNALKHYDKLSQEDCNWLSTIPHAIEIYRKYLKKELVEPMSENEIFAIIVRHTIENGWYPSSDNKCQALTIALVGKIGKEGK